MKKHRTKKTGAFWTAHAGRYLYVVCRDKQDGEDYDRDICECTSRETGLEIAEALNLLEQSQKAATK